MLLHIWTLYVPLFIAISLPCTEWAFWRQLCQCIQGTIYNSVILVLAWLSFVYIATPISPIQIRYNKAILVCNKIIKNISRLPWFHEITQRREYNKTTEGNETEDCQSSFSIITLGHDGTRVRVYDHIKFNHTPFSK